MDGTERFMKRFNIPKPTQKKEEPSLDAFRDYEELCMTFIKFFEELSGRKVNAAKAIENLVYFFDQGFELDDLVAHTRYQQRADFYLTNPEYFTINNLFHIKDPDKCNAVWDKLAFHQSQRNKSEKIAISSRFLYLCGHSGDSSVFECIQCISAGDERAIMIHPYSVAVPASHSELAEHFRRNGNESLAAYAKRTLIKRKEINANYGVIITESHFAMLGSI